MRDGFSLIEALAAVALLALAALPLYEMADALLRASDRLAAVSQEIETAGDAAAMRRATVIERETGLQITRNPRSMLSEMDYAGGHLGFDLVGVDLRAGVARGSGGEERVFVYLAFSPRYESVDELLDDTL